MTTPKREREPAVPERKVEPRIKALPPPPVGEQTRREVGKLFGESPLPPPPPPPSRPGVSVSGAPPRAREPGRSTVLNPPPSPPQRIVQPPAPSASSRPREDAPEKPRPLYRYLRLEMERSEVVGGGNVFCRYEIDPSLSADGKIVYTPFWSSDGRVLGPWLQFSSFEDYERALAAGMYQTYSLGTSDNPHNAEEQVWFYGGKVTTEKPAEV